MNQEFRIGGKPQVQNLLQNQIPQKHEESGPPADAGNELY